VRARGCNVWWVTVVAECDKRMMGLGMIRGCQRRGGEWKTRGGRYPKSTHAWARGAAWVTLWGPASGVLGDVQPRLGPEGRVGDTPRESSGLPKSTHAWAWRAAWVTLWGPASSVLRGAHPA
jgi:hypothetical protein